MSFNKILIYGHLGRDPELRYTATGTPVCNFSMATTQKNGQKDETTWFRVTFFGRQAEIANDRLYKGKDIYIEGRLSLDKYVDREGKERTTLEVIGTELKFVGKNEDSERSTQRSGYDQTRKGADDHDQRTKSEDPEDVPF